PMSSPFATVILACEPVGAGGDARQGNKLAPPESRSHGSELFGHGAVKLFRVQAAVLADRITQQDVEHGPSGMAVFAVSLHESARSQLVIRSDSSVELSQERRRLGGLDVRQLLLCWERLLLMAAVASVFRPPMASRYERGRQNETGRLVAN